MSFRRIPAAAALAAGLLAVTAGSASAAPWRLSPALSCNPVHYGAHPGGTSDNAMAIQHAIDACAARGGGTVRLHAPGVYVTGPIALRSHITLQLDKDVTLQASSDTSLMTWGFIGYTYAQSDPTHPEALVSAKDVTDVAITGEGKIDGQGQQMYWDEAKLVKKDSTSYKSALTYAQLAQMIEANPQKGSNLPASFYATLGAIPTSNGLPRPWLVEFYHASHVRVEGVTLNNSPQWTLALRYSQNVQVERLHVHNPSDSPNTDGIDVCSSRNVALRHLDIGTGDDDIAIKSGFPGFPTPAVATSGVSVTDSAFGTGHGVSIGSEADNGVNNVALANLSFTGTDNGFRIKSGRDRGADISNVTAVNLSMTNVGVPLFLTDYYTGQPTAGTDTGQPVTATTPHIHDVTIVGLRATGAKSSEMVGLPEAPLRHIRLAAVSIAASTGLELRNVQGVALGLHVTAQTGPNLVVEEGVHIAGLPS